MTRSGFEKSFQAVVIAACFIITTLLYPGPGAEIIPEVSVGSDINPNSTLRHRPTDDNLPEAGFSLFDQIFSIQTSMGFEYDVPYPFEKVLDRLSAHQSDAIDFDQERIVAVLIPRGRSLQRDAARPDFFRYPRLLIAIDSEFIYRNPTRDRLFLGYQEKADIIEVISYNESLGRFEFQIVRNYAKGKAPLVQYANRVLCTSCHQNAAPIFPNASWSETNHDSQIARRIGEHHAIYHGVPTNRLSGKAGRFDSATDRANLFSVYQQLWQQGCGSDSHGGRSCRASIFMAMLHYRLASVPRPRFDSPFIRDHLLPVLQTSFNRLWPEGLPIPVGNLRDRSPVLDTPDSKLPPDLDPLSFRPPQFHWSYQRAADLTILGLSKDFLLDSDIDLLDDYLYQLAYSDMVPTRHYPGNCIFEFHGSNNTEDWLPVECTLNDKSDKAFLSLSGELYIQSNGQLDQNLSWLYVTENQQSIRASVSGSIGTNKFPSTAKRLQLFKPFHRLHSRLRDNRLISQITFEFDRQLVLGDTKKPGDNRFNGSVSLQLANDFSVIERAVVGLLEDAAAGKFKGFNNSPIQGTAIMDALFLKIGIESPGTSSLATPAGLILQSVSNSTDMRLNLSDQQPVATYKSPFRVFTRYCATCHNRNTRLPPGFLAGSQAQIKNQLASCAPRIARRLGIWGLDEESWLKSPMPPLNYLKSNSIDPVWWRNSIELKLLRDYVVSLDPEKHTGIAYEKLPSCLPE